MKIAVSLLILILAIAHAEIAASGPAKTVETQAVTASVSSASSLEFYTDANVLYKSTIPFTHIDPANRYNYADGRKENDGKSDVGLVIITTSSDTWYFKIRGTDAGGDMIGKGKVAVYVGQPINRNTGLETNGTLGQAKDWFTILTSDHTLYTSGSADTTNAPFGTLITLSFKVDGTGLSSGPYAAIITYTMTTTP